MKKCIRITLWVLGIIVLLIVILALLTITPPLTVSYTVADAEADSLLASEIVDMISDAVVDDEGNIPEIAVVTIPAENVNALLRIAGYRLSRELEEEGIVCTFAWENGAIKAAGSYPLPLSKAAVGRALASPLIENGKMNVSVSSLKLGHLPLPGSILSFHDITEKDIEDDAAKLAFDAIHSLSATPEGSLKIGVYPEKVSNLIRILITDED